MRIRPRPIWVLALIALGLLIVLNRMSVQTLSSADIQSLKDRDSLHVQLNALEKRVEALERRPR